MWYSKDTLPGPRTFLSPSLTRGPFLSERVLKAKETVNEQRKMLLATKTTLHGRAKFDGWTPLTWLNEQNWLRIEYQLDG